MTGDENARPGISAFQRTLSPSLQTRGGLPGATPLPSGPRQLAHSCAPSEVAADISAAPTFTPFTVAPALQNLQEVQRALVREYPTVLRDSGIGGTVTVWFFINEEGRVLDTRVDQSSGYQQLDDAALKVADVMRFSPALNRENRVQVWVSLPITFQVR